MGLQFTGVLFERLGMRGTRIERAFSVPWCEDEILNVFGSYQATDKHAQQLFSAATYAEGAKRGKAGIQAITAAVLDCDCADPGALDNIVCYLARNKRAFVTYTSWSHELASKVHKGTGKSGPFDCFRVILPYSRHISPAEHAAIVPALYGYEVPADPKHYADEVRGAFITKPNGHRTAAMPRGWDPVCSRPAQPYFIPSMYSSVDVMAGSPLDVDAILARPATARPSQQILRTWTTPDVEAIHAMSQVVRELTKRTQVDEQGGWYRAACPSCAPSGVQRSPSFTARANGNGVDIFCHAHCTRVEVLGALGLTPEGALAAPSNVRLQIDEQLAAQEPAGEPAGVSEAVERLVEDIREAVVSREPTIIQYPAGTGKSYASAKVITEHALQGYRIAYSTQEHAVAYETRKLLPPEVRARSVHIHSPLIQVGDEPVCSRADELKERVFEYGVSLLGSICPRCPKRESCAAYEAAKQRAKDIESASVVFVSHAGIRQVFGDGKGEDMQLIVDEMPGTYEAVELSLTMLKELAKCPALPSADTGSAHLVYTLAKAWVEGREAGEVTWGPHAEPLGDANGLALEWGRLSLREGAHPRPTEQPYLKAADALIRLCAYRQDGGKIEGIGKTDLVAMLPDACHEALVRRGGTLLSATPMLIALPGFKLRECRVTDGAKVLRKMVPRSGRGSGALASSFWNDARGVLERRAPEPGEQRGIPWHLVEAALVRADGERRKYACKRVLFVSFKFLVDALRKRGVPDWVELAHYGALRGKNDWQEGAPKECGVVYLFGSPRMGVMPTIQQLGQRGLAAAQAWTAYAAGELEQAEGRLRMPRRTKPCTVFCEGDIAPLSWHHDNVDQWIEEDYLMTPTAALHAAGVWYSRAELRETLGGNFETQTDALWRLSNPSASEALGLLRDMPLQRRETLLSLFSWLPLDA